MQPQGKPPKMRPALQRRTRQRKRMKQMERRPEPMRNWNFAMQHHRLQPRKLNFAKLRSRLRSADSQQNFRLSQKALLVKQRRSAASSLSAQTQMELAAAATETSSSAASFAENLKTMTRALLLVQSRCLCSQKRLRAGPSAMETNWCRLKTKLRPLMLPRLSLPNCCPQSSIPASQKMACWAASGLMAQNWKRIPSNLKRKTIQTEPSWSRPEPSLKTPRRQPPNPMQAESTTNCLKHWLIPRRRIRWRRPPSHA